MGLELKISIVYYDFFFSFWEIVVYLKVIINYYFLLNIRLINYGFLLLIL